MPLQNQHIGVVNPLAPSQACIEGHYYHQIGPCAVNALSSQALDGRSIGDVTLLHPTCRPTWRRSHFTLVLPCMAIGSTSEQRRTRGGRERVRPLALEPKCCAHFVWCHNIRSSPSGAETFFAHRITLTTTFYCYIQLIVKSTRSG